MVSDASERSQLFNNLFLSKEELCTPGLSYLFIMKEHTSESRETEEAKPEEETHKSKWGIMNPASNLDCRITEDYS